MDELFFKSALPAQDTFLLDDTSLALPSEPSARSSTKHVSNDRSLRVHQQVQLTLARKARRSVSNGSVSLQKHTAKSFDAADGLLPNTKMNGWALTSHSEASSRLQKPSRRVEVSPPPSPQLPRSRFNYSAYRFGTVTLPIQSHRVSPPLGHSFGFDSCRRYAFSEVPRLTRPHASTSAHGSFRQRSLRQAAGQQPMFAQAAFHGGGEYDSGWSHNQTVVKQEIPTLQAAFQGGVEYDSGWSHNQTILKQEIPNVQAAFQGGGEYDSGWNHNQAVLKQEIPTIQASGGGMILGVTQPEEEISWLAQMRREGLELQRRNSYPPSVVSMEVDMGKQMEADSPIQQMQAQKVTTLKSENKPPEMTLERAVNLLTQDDEEMLICAASHIQNQCFKSADAKKMVYYLRGIGKLLQLLQSDNEEVQRVVAGALRNVVYQSDENKMEVKEGRGLATVLDALKSSRDTETRRQLTGLLWNLSSHDILKERLTKEALPVLIKSVLVPSSGISEGENPKDELLADADVFHFATGCLRNLSSSGPDGRKAMRDCENLIDSLVYYVRGTIADHKTDDKSTENCVCILHNLSYQIEAELPKKYTQDLRESRQNLAPKQKSVSCFPDRSAKITEQLQRQSPLLEDKANPRGIEWLWSSITIRMYMSLIARSVRHYTQEAAIGALQNITAGNGPVSEAITFTIVQRENGLQQIKKMLQEGERDVKRTAMSLIENASRYQDLHPEIVNQVLPEVVEMLPNDDTGTDLPTAVTCCLCHILTNLSQSNSQHVRAIVNQGALPKIINISSKDKGCGPSRAGNAACVLLHTMWKHKDLHRAYKKCGYKKADFVNARTTKAVNSGNY